jgi:hypothetical protein
MACIRTVRVAFAGLVLLAAAGCAENQSVISALPEPSVRPDVGPGTAVQPGPVRPQILAARYQPWRGPWMVPVRAASLGEPGWVPVIGVSSRWTCIVVHHSASDKGTPQAIDQAHRQRGWDELGYHFVIGNGVDYPDGQIYVGSRWDKQKHGAHCKVPGNYYNEHGIGICLIGNLEEHPPTAAQMAALSRLIAFLEEQCGLDYDRVLTHGGITGKTLCPGRYFSMNDLYRRINAPLYASRK